MAKTKTAFFCQNCGTQSAKWVGKCTSCKEWNTYVEEVLTKTEDKKVWQNQETVLKSTKPFPIHSIEFEKEKRINTKNQELNRVLGGGIVPGSLVLIGGEPGIGKSTLLLQIALNLKQLKILYVTGEESAQQIKMRADRLGEINPNCYLLTETSTQKIFTHINQLNPDLLVIDSIQTLHTDTISSSAGSISQIRESAAELQKYAKITNTPVILIGHITKEGALAGPKILEHMVDVVLQFEGDRNYDYRILRSIKNRYGSTSELGIYEMRENGLREVSNPSELLVSQRDVDISGITIASTIEGARPMLIETQALVSTAVYGTPQRTTTGFDTKRLNMLLAVLEKRCGFKLGMKDVFLNITGGIKVDDPAIDLSVACSVLSSSEDTPIKSNIAFTGEIGLTGEIRSVNRIDQRIGEADKQGYKQIFLSKQSLKSININKFEIEVMGVNKIDDILHKLF